MCNMTPSDRSNASRRETAAVDRCASPDRLQGRILLAEDLPESSRLICWVLRRAGASIEAVANGREALHALCDVCLERSPFSSY